MPTIAHQLSPFLPVWSGYIILSTLLFSFDGAKLPTLLHLVFTGTIKFATVITKICEQLQPPLQYLSLLAPCLRSCCGNRFVLEVFLRSPLFIHN